MKKEVGAPSPFGVELPCRPNGLKRSPEGFTQRLQSECFPAFKWKSEVYPFVITRNIFHFEPISRSEAEQTESAPLLFTSNPPGRQGQVTLFFRTRKTLRRRLGVYDLGELDGVFSEKASNEQPQPLQKALGKASNFTYLFPDNGDDNRNESAASLTHFSSLINQTINGCSQAASFSP